MGHGVGQLILEDGSEAARHPLDRSGLKHMLSRSGFFSTQRNN
jgi:hypothetical protein